VIEAAARASERRIPKIGVEMEALWKVLAGKQSDSVVNSPEPSTGPAVGA